jgi:hypothetical protein
MSKKEFPPELQSKLDEFHVDVPDIPVHRSKLDRIANWIYAPSKDPLELFHVKESSITRLVLYPFIFLLVLFFIPSFFI